MNDQQSEEVKEILKVIAAQLDRFNQLYTLKLAHDGVIELRQQQPAQTAPQPAAQKPVQKKK